jgi:hypothetical protein
MSISLIFQMTSLCLIFEELMNAAESSCIANGEPGLIQPTSRGKLDLEEIAFAYGDGSLSRGLVSFI